MSSGEKHGEPVYGSHLTIVHGPDCCPEPLPRDATALAEMMREIDQRTEGEGGEVERLYERLQAQVGYAEAYDLWGNACATYDMLFSDAEAAGVSKPVTETAQQIEARVRAELGKQIYAERERIGAIAERAGRTMTEAEWMRCTGLMSAHKIVTGKDVRTVPGE